MRETLEAIHEYQWTFLFLCLGIGYVFQCYRDK